MAQSTSPRAATSPAREAIRGTVPKLAEIADTLIYGQIWEGPHLSKRDRSLCTKDEIAELITHLAFYSGWPTAMTAARLAKEVFEGR